MSTAVRKSFFKKSLHFTCLAFSGILSYLFELNVEKDEALRTRIMKCITKTVTLAKDRVQLHVDLVEYLPELSNFARSANAARKIEIVRLYLIFASEVGHGIELLIMPNTFPYPSSSLLITITN